MMNFGRYAFVAVCLVLTATGLRAQSPAGGPLGAASERTVLRRRPIIADHVTVVRNSVSALMPAPEKDHTLVGGVAGAVVGGVGFALYINGRCQRHRSDAGCGPSVTLAAAEGAVVGAFVGAIIGRRI